jgi:transposase
MNYWGIDLGKKVIALVARDENGTEVATKLVQSQKEVVSLIAPTDAVVIEWTGGKARPLLEALFARGCRQLYLYQGLLRADRLHVGYTRKGDYQDAATLSYALWASLTGHRFRGNALIDYVNIREVYELRMLYARAETLLKERVRLQNRLASYIEKGAARAEFQNLLGYMERAAEQAYQELRLACMEHPQVRRVVAVLQKLFPSSDRAIYGLAVQIAPLERFGSVAAFKRYLELLPTHGSSGGKVVERSKWRGGNRRARVLMYRLLYANLRIGGKRRGKWRDYYDQLRRRMPHGKAMIRMMNRLAERIYSEYHRGAGEQQMELPRSKQAVLQEQVLQLVARGLSDYQAAKALGIHISTISKWKRRDERFLERYIRARLEAEHAREDKGGN